MIRRLAAALPVALLACSGPAPSVQPPPPSAAEQACAAQADDDPALKEARAITAGQPDYQWQHGPQIAQLKRDAITRCLRARGLAPRGSVEKPR